MRLPLQVTSRADADIATIEDLLLQRSITAARRFLDVLDLAFAHLSEFPESGVGNPDLGPRLRVLVRRPWIIVYRLQAGRVEVLRVISGRADLRGIVEP